MMKSTPRFDDLVDISTRLFREHGFAGTTVRMIAKEMGVLSGSLYSHISSKDEILVRIVMSVASLYFERVHDIAKEPDASQQDKLRRMVKAHLSVLHDRSDAVSVYFDEWRRLDDPYRAEIAAARNEYEQLFVDVITEGMSTGEFAVVHPRDAANVLLGACNWTYQWYRPDRELSTDQLADRYTDIALRGILSRGT